MTLPIISTLEIGLIYSLVALGVYLTFRIINFPDLTVDGSFSLGAAVTAILLVNDASPVLATLIAAIAGSAAGLVTGFLHCRLRIMGLLASILTMTALYSINIRVMGRPNISLFNVNTLFSNTAMEYGIVTFLALVIMLLLVILLRTDFGLSIRAAGINPTISRSYGVSLNRITMSMLALSNSLVALAGSLFAQSQGFADVTLGTGTIIIGLASVLTGEALIRTTRVAYCLLACVVGSILYRFIIAIALNGSQLGMQASDLNLITAVLVTLALSTTRLKNLFTKTHLHHGEMTHDTAE